MLLKMNNDKVLRAESFSHEMFLRDQKAQFKTAREEGLEEGIAKGLEEGLVKGKAEGKAEGIQEGLVKGKAEGIQENKKEIAKKLFQSGQTKEFISSITGLSLEELNNILK